MSEVFCGTLEIRTQDFSHRLEVGPEIKLFKIKLSNFQELASSLIEFLSPFEKDKANRYHFYNDKNRFIICRALLKFLLAEQTGLEVDKVLIENHCNQKPYLRSHPSVFFNLTHAGDYAIIALAKGSIGVDIEYVNKDFDYHEVVSSIFNMSEKDEVNNSKNGQHSFYKLWTRKEAFVKATGKGIGDFFSSIPSTDGYHFVCSELLGDIDILQVFSFELNKDYLGAVAISSSSDLTSKLLLYHIPFEFQETICTNKFVSI